MIGPVLDFEGCRDIANEVAGQHPLTGSGLRGGAGMSRLPCEECLGGKTGT